MKTAQFDLWHLPKGAVTSMYRNELQEDHFTMNIEIVEIFETCRNQTRLAKLPFTIDLHEHQTYFLHVRLLYPSMVVDGHLFF